MIEIFLVGYILPVILAVILDILVSDEISIKDILKEWVFILIPCINIIVCVGLVIMFISDNLPKIKVYSTIKERIEVKWEKFINYKIK